MEEQFLKEQSTYRYNPESMRNVAKNEIGRINYIPWNPVPNNQNGINLGAVIDDHENEEVFLVNVIKIKGVARKLEPGYKPLRQVQTLSR